MGPTPAAWPLLPCSHPMKEARGRAWAFMKCGVGGNGDRALLPALGDLEGVSGDLAPAHAVPPALALRPRVSHEAVHLLLVQPCMPNAPLWYRIAILHELHRLSHFIDCK